MRGQVVLGRRSQEARERTSHSLRQERVTDGVGTLLTWKALWLARTWLYWGPSEEPFRMTSLSL